MMYVKRFACILLMVFFSVTEGMAAISSINVEKAADLLATMLISGRGVVARHQGLINDPNKGDKGFTPDYVEKEMIEAFKEMTGIDDINALEPEILRAVRGVLASAKRSVLMNQARINRKGMAFKGYIPAVFGRETGQILRTTTGIDIKQTTFKYRNQYNKPDPFESEVLKKFQDLSYTKGAGYGKMVEGKYRYLKPIYIKEACLKCHGEPKGELDIAGRKKEGYKVGELRGAVSVSIDVK